MKKRLFAVLMCIAMLATMLPTTVFAGDGAFVVDGFELEVSKESSDGKPGEVTVTQAPATATNVTLDTVTDGTNSYEVTEVGDRAFMGCTSLESVILPKVTAIGISAFSGCTSLKSVILPKVTTIGDSAFSGCESLKSVSLPMVTAIGISAFSGCTNLESVTIWKDVSGLDGNTFDGERETCTLYAPPDYCDGYGGVTSTVKELCPVSGIVYESVDNFVPNATVSVYGISTQASGDGSYTVYVKPNDSTTITAQGEAGVGSISVSNVKEALTRQDIHFGTIAAPTFSPAQGTFTGTQSVTLTCDINGATIYYTTNGMDPTTESNKYSGPISVTATTTIKAKAFIPDVPDVGKNGIASATYTITTGNSSNDSYDYTSAPVTVYNDPSTPNSTIWLTGAGLSSSDLLITQRDPAGSAYEAMMKLAEHNDVLATYNISLKSGQKRHSAGMRLTFDLNAKFARQDFTLVHQKVDTTYEYFYDTADANGDLNFGPLYELSPFMLVKGKIAQNPDTGDSSAPALCLGIMVMAGAGIVASLVLGRKK